MKTCIYCGKAEPERDFSSLEHLIPQFLGGACAPARFKTYDACARCNSVLGLFVDGSFAKSWMVTNWLTFAGLAAYTSSATKGPPLMFMGVTQWEMPGVEEHEVCETWLGPAGEQIYLIRQKDDRFYWYAGGNPIDAKSLESRAYFMFSEKSNENARRTLLSFRDAFDGLCTKKLSCTEVNGFELSTIGFSDPDELDYKRIEFLRSESRKTPVRTVSIPMNLHFDYRFMSKLAIGVGYAFFGYKLLQSDYYQELRRGLWYRDGEPVPAIRGAGALGQNQYVNSEAFRKIIGTNHAVTLIVSVVPQGAVATLTLGSSHAWTVLCAPREIISDEFLQELDIGKAFVIYPFLNECIELTLAGLLSHKLTAHIDQKLASAEIRASIGQPKPGEGDLS